MFFNRVSRQCCSAEEEEEEAVGPEVGDAFPAATEEEEGAGGGGETLGGRPGDGVEDLSDNKRKRREEKQRDCERP